MLRFFTVVLVAAAMSMLAGGFVLKAARVNSATIEQLGEHKW